MIILIIGILLGWLIHNIKYHFSQEQRNDRAAQLLGTLLHHCYRESKNVKSFTGWDVKEWLRKESPTFDTFINQIEEAKKR
jgi:hypothetical protein